MIAILVLAALLRLGHLYAVADEPFVASLIVDSREYDRWAREIAAGDWWGTEVFFQAPLYPYFLAVVYTVLGHHLLAVYLLQIAGGVAACWALFRAGQLAGGPRLGLAASALAACYGPFLFYETLLLKESLAATTAAFLLWALILARSRGLDRWWFVAGLGLGALALLRENALLLAPLLALLVRTPGRQWRQWLRSAACFALGFAAPLLPVAARNAAVGGSPLPTASNFGVNFYIGNNPRADGTYRPLAPGRQVPALEARAAQSLAEQEVGRPLTPAEVSSYWLRRALGWAAAEPLAFARLQATKLRFYWSWYEWPDAVDYYDFGERSPILRVALVEFGAISLLAVLGLVLSWPAGGLPWWPKSSVSLLALLPAIVFALSWMLATVAFFLFSRFRLPAVPALILLAAIPVAQASRWRQRRGVWLSILCLACVAVPPTLGFAPRLDLVHGNLARLAEEAGRGEEARGHYRKVLEVAPNDLGALLGLGADAARAKDWVAALGYFSRARESAPESGDAAASLGGTLVVLGRFDEAEAELRRALRLDPDNQLATRNLDALRRKRAALEAQGRRLEEP
jgi:tetratricopeptide (TPR) repeat protein